MRNRNAKSFFAFPILILLITALFPVLISKSSDTYYFLESTHNGDLIVDGNTTFLIESSTYNLIGNLIVRDNAAVIIKNCFFNQSASDTVRVFVEDMARLVVINATLFISQKDITKISISDNAILNITNSILINSNESFYVWPTGNATIHVDNCIIKGGQAKEGFLGGRVVGDENSTVYIKNSMFDSLVFWANSVGFIENVTLTYGLRVFSLCSVYVKNLTVGYVTAEGSCQLNIRDSNVVSYISSGETSKIVLIRSFVNNTVHAKGNSTIWLIDSAVKEFREDDSSLIFIGWELPIIGIVAFHHKFIPTLQIIAMLIVGCTASVVVLVVLRKREKRTRSS